MKKAMFSIVFSCAIAHHVAAPHLPPMPPAMPPPTGAPSPAMPPPSSPSAMPPAPSRLNVPMPPPAGMPSPQGPPMPLRSNIPMPPPAGMPPPQGPPVSSRSNVPMPPPSGAPMPPDVAPVRGLQPLAPGMRRPASADGFTSYHLDSSVIQNAIDEVMDEARVVISQLLTIDEVTDQLRKDVSRVMIIAQFYSQQFVEMGTMSQITGLLADAKEYLHNTKPIPSWMLMDIKRNQGITKQWVADQRPLPMPQPGVNYNLKK